MIAWILAIGCSPTPRSPGLELALPIACDPGRTCFVQNYFDHDPGLSAQDYGCRSRTYDGHNGTDFRVTNVVAMHAGVDVIASAPGTVRAVRDGEPERLLLDGEPAPPGKECGNGVVLDHGDGWETQYCHLAGGSVAVVVGDVVATGARLGSVGLSGATQFPHVHLGVRHNGAEVDPFGADLAPGGCGAAASMWSPHAAASLAGPATVVLDAGFASGPVSLDEAERGEVPLPDTSSPAILAWARAMSLEAGDVQSIRLLDPDGVERSAHTGPPLPRSKATYVLYTGERNAAGRLQSGLTFPGLAFRSRHFRQGRSRPSIAVPRKSAVLRGARTAVPPVERHAHPRRNWSSRWRYWYVASGSRYSGWKASRIATKSPSGTASPRECESGTWRLQYTVTRGGAVVQQREASIQL